MITKQCVVQFVASYVHVAAQWPAMYMLQPNGQLCACCSPMACAVNVSMIMHACSRLMGKVGHMTPDLG